MSTERLYNPDLRTLLANSDSGEDLGKSAYQVGTYTYPRTYPNYPYGVHIDPRIKSGPPESPDTLHVSCMYCFYHGP